MFESRSNHEAIISLLLPTTVYHYNFMETHRVYVRMVSKLDPGWTFCDIFKELSFLFCDREQQLDIMGFLNLLLMYYVTVECWWWTIVFSFGLLIDC